MSNTVVSAAEQDFKMMSETTAKIAWCMYISLSPIPWMVTKTESAAR